MRMTLPRPLLMRGKIVQPDGSAADRYVLVRNGVIKAVSRLRPPLSEDALLIETKGNDWIFPGLINLHSHTNYNVLPIWEPKEKKLFNNRFEWRSDPDYKQNVSRVASQVEKKLGVQGTQIVAAFAEIQGIAGGTTVLQEMRGLDRNSTDGQNPVLCRGTRDPRDLDLRPGRSILSVTDFFKPSATRSKPTEATHGKGKLTSIADYEKRRDKGQLQATLVHLAEGRSGFATFRGVDPYTRLEWETFKNHPCMRVPENVRTSSLALIHGSGIDRHDANLSFLRDRGISLIWSPVSNLLLYGDTLEVEPLVNGGVNVALGSDWSPSGSKHIWDEAKNARFLFQAIGSPVSDVQVFQMTTVNAARCLGLSNIGRVAEGCLADFFILRSPLESDSAMEVFFKTEDRDVRAVIVGGRPIYGDREFLAQFGLQLQDLPRVEGESVKGKAVNLPTELNVRVERDIDRLEAEFKKQGIKRSNLLVSSDIPYQGRITRLQNYMLEYGWRVRRWRRRQKRASQVQVPVPPEAVRVWWGFRPCNLSLDKFRERLSVLFMPITPHVLVPLGLTAYLPALTPDGVRETVPDEIALVFYDSQQAYETARDTVAGRAYSALHGIVFDFEERRSFSSWPIRLPKNLRGLKRSQPYFLFDEPTDWQRGYARVLIGQPAAKDGPTRFLETICTRLQALRNNPPEGLDGAIVVATESFLLYWEHWQEERQTKNSPVRSFERLVDVVLSRPAVPIFVSKSLQDVYPGFGKLKGGEAFNVQFERRWSASGP